MIPGPFQRGRPTRGHGVVPDSLAVTTLAAVAVAFFFWRFGWHVLDPLSTHWCLAGGDTAMSQIAWRSFQTEPWHMPPGKICNYGAPLGSSIALVDGIPVIAIPAKLAFAWLKRPWQYLGSWLLVAHVLQAVAGWVLLGRILEDRLQRFLGSIMLLLMPAFCHRWGHIALSTHGLLLLALALYQSTSPRRISGLWMALVAISALVHPYLLAMVLAIGAAWLIRGVLVTRDIRWTLAVFTGALGAGIALASWWLSGMFVYGLSANELAGGYGRFSLNLNSLVNPAGYSRFLKPLAYVNDDQWEGFAYLGLGHLGTWLFAMGAVVAGRIKLSVLKGHWPLILVMVCCLVFALSNKIALNDRYILTTSVPHVAEPLTRAFRASGRFVWVLVYAGSAFAFWALARAFPRRWISAWLALALALQVADASQWIAQPAAHTSVQRVSRLQDAAWPQVFAATRGVFSYPPFQHSTQYDADFADLALPVIAEGKPTSTVYLTRNPGALAGRVADAWRRRLERGELDPNLLYIVRDSDFPAVYSAMGSDFRGYNLDGYRVCLHDSRPLADVDAYTIPRPVGLVDFLTEHRPDILVIAVADEATTNLPEAARQMLKGMGSSIEALAYRGSYAAVSVNGRIAWDKVDNQAAVSATFEAGARLGEVICARSLDVFSAGLPHGNSVRIRLDGRDEGFVCRGLNVLALSNDWQPLAIGLFDTYAGGPGLVMDVVPNR